MGESHSLLNSLTIGTRGSPFEAYTFPQFVKARLKICFTRCARWSRFFRFAIGEPRVLLRVVKSIVHKVVNAEAHKGALLLHHELHELVVCVHCQHVFA
jgi:hypothetical protein